MRRYKYIIMWTYYDEIGSLGGHIEMLGTNRENAEEEFYRLNQPYILEYKNGCPVINPDGGYVCECVLTYNEWVKEGSPEKIYNDSLNIEKVMELWK